MNQQQAPAGRRLELVAAVLLALATVATAWSAAAATLAFGGIVFLGTLIWIAFLPMRVSI